MRSAPRLPHRVGTRAAIIRNGAWYRVRVPQDAIAKANAHRERVVRDGLLPRDGTVLLASRRRVDVLIELSEPVRIQRPFHEPLTTRMLAVAGDDPDDLIARLSDTILGGSNEGGLWTVSRRGTTEKVALPAGTLVEPGRDRRRTARQALRLDPLARGRKRPGGADRARLRGPSRAAKG